MLDLKDVTLSYRKKTILRDVNISAKPGEIIGLLGMNGSGKSTLLSAMAGVKKPAAGSILLHGKTYADDPKQYNSAIGYVTQENALIDELSAMDNLRLWTAMDKAAILDTLQNTNLSILGVHTYITLPVNSMSGGMKKRLSIATVLINKPGILLLDEPFAALDLVAKQDILNFLFAFRAGGGLAVVASHDEKIFDFCNEVFLLKDGVCTSFRSLPENSTPADLLRSTTV